MTISAERTPTRIEEVRDLLGRYKAYCADTSIGFSPEDQANLIRMTTVLQYLKKRKAAEIAVAAAVNFDNPRVSNYIVRRTKYLNSRQQYLLYQITEREATKGPNDRKVQRHRRNLEKANSELNRIATFTTDKTAGFVDYIVDSKNLSGNYSETITAIANKDDFTWDTNATTGENLFLDKDSAGNKSVNKANATLALLYLKGNHAPYESLLRINELDKLSVENMNTANKAKIVADSFFVEVERHNEVAKKLQVAESAIAALSARKSSNSGIANFLSGTNRDLKRQQRALKEAEKQLQEIDKPLREMYFNLSAVGATAKLPENIAMANAFVSVNPDSKPIFKSQITLDDSHKVEVKESININLRSAQNKIDAEKAACESKIPAVCKSAKPEALDKIIQHEKQYGAVSAKKDFEPTIINLSTMLVMEDIRTSKGAKATARTAAMGSVDINKSTGDKAGKISYGDAKNYITGRGK